MTAGAEAPPYMSFLQSTPVHASTLYGGPSVATSGPMTVHRAHYMRGVTSSLVSCLRSPVSDYRHGRHLGRSTGRGGGTCSGAPLRMAAGVTETSASAA
jgi:hypothetical protein